MTTLAERFEKLAALRPDISKGDIARSCGVKPPSVTGWFSGGSKNLKAETAIKAANLYGVSLEWLTSGKGEMLPTQSGATPPDYKPNQPLAPVEPARAAININANRRMKPTSQDVVAELGALLAGVEPGRMGSVIAALTDLARSPTDEVLRDSLARLMAPAAFTLPNQRMGS